MCRDEGPRQGFFAFGLRAAGERRRVFKFQVKLVCAAGKAFRLERETSMEVLQLVALRL